MMTEPGPSDGSARSSRSSDHIDPGFVMLPARLVDGLLERLVRLSKGAFTGLSDRAFRLGHVGLVLGSTVFAGFVLIGNFLEPLFKLLVVALVLLGAGLGQFAALRFTGMCGALVRNTPTRTSNILVFQFLGLLMVVAAVVVLLISLLALREEGAVAVLNLHVGIVSAMSLLVPGLLLLDPEGTLHVTVDSSCSAGEDGLGIIGTLLKGYLAGVRLIYGGLCGVGGAAVIVGVPMVLLSDQWSVPGINLVFLGVWTISIGATTPLLTYLVSVIYYILVDVLTAVIRRGRAGA